MGSFVWSEYHKVFPGGFLYFFADFYEFTPGQVLHVLFREAGLLQIILPVIEPCAAAVKGYPVNLAVHGIGIDLILGKLAEINGVRQVGVFAFIIVQEALCAVVAHEQDIRHAF